MKNKIISTCLRTFILAGLFISSFAQAQNNQIKRLGSNDGLSNSAINTIFQDWYGIMWFGTWDGLNRYTGTGFDNYRPQKQDSVSISNHIIRDIFQEQEGILWITTDYGINRFDILQNTFKSFYLDFKDKGTYRERSFCTTRNSKGVIIASAYNSGMYIYNSAKLEFIPLLLEGVDQDGITSLFFDSYDHLWLINEHKEVRQIAFTYLDANRQEIQQNSLVNLPSWEIICYDGNNRLWLQHEDLSISYYSISNHTHGSLTSHVVWGKLNTALSANGNFLLATGKGLVKLNQQSSFEEILFPGVPILSLYVGTQDILWAGTDSQGIIQISPQQKHFNSFTNNEIPELSNYPVRSFFRDVDNNLWIGTKGGGLIRIESLNDDKDKLITRITDSKFKSNSILCLSPALGNDFWIGTDSKGLSYYSYNEKKIKNLKGNTILNTSLIYSVYSILQSNDSTLWIGTSGNGLFKLQVNKISDEYQVRGYEHFHFRPNQTNTINNNIIYSLAITNDSILWIATRGGGLNKLNIHTHQFDSYKYNSDDDKSLSSNDVLCLYATEDKQLLIGTGMGLNILSDDNGKTGFERYTESTGLSNNTIHGILTDHDNRIWLSTNKGITRLNTQSSSHVHYYYNDGLQDNEFSDGAYLASNNKEDLYFGGINGFSIFHPSQIGVSDYIPPLLLKSFQIDNVSQTLHLDRKKTYISYKSSFLTFKFDILDYISNNMCQMAYQVKHKGYDGNEWISIKNGRDIILTNLTPGDYTLQVKYSNGDNNWSNELFSFRFEVTPVWWQSNFAYLSYFIALCLLGYWFFWMHSSKIRMQHKLELDKIENQRNEDIHQAKLSFFTNIAHEFSNSITLIYGPCEQVLKRNQLHEKDYSYLQVIKRNAERMQNQIQQLMEFRKAETGHLSLHYECIDVVELVKYTLDSFTDMASQNKIDLIINLSPQVPRWVTDRDMLEKVIFNLVSNAFKYTPDEGKISITLSVESNELCFQVTNSGLGIKFEEIPLLFNRFKVLDNFESKLSKGIYTRTGIGLAMCRNLVELLNGTISVDSKMKEYTTFRVLLPQQPESLLNPTTSKGNIETNNASPTFSTKDYLPDKKYTILIVDDQAEIRSLIKDILSDFNTCETENGKDALAEIQNNLPDLIVCDILMPVMDGIEFLKILKQQKETAHIPVILLSSRNSIESQIEGLEIGAQMFLSKPFHPTHLLAMVNRSLNSQLITKSYLESPQAHAEQFMGRSIDKQDKEFICEVIELLQKNLDDETYNQDALANDMAVSRMQLYRKIKTITVNTPAEFIRNFRLHEVEKLLKNTSKTVQEIMIDCGFHNKAYFYREFSKVYKCTPKEYRNKSN